MVHFQGRPLRTLKQCLGTTQLQCWVECACHHQIPSLKGSKASHLPFLKVCIRESLVPSWLMCKTYIFSYLELAMVIVWCWHSCCYCSYLHVPLEMFCWMYCVGFLYWCYLGVYCYGLDLLVQWWSPYWRKY